MNNLTSIEDFKIQEKVINDQMNAEQEAEEKSQNILHKKNPSLGEISEDVVEAKQDTEGEEAEEEEDYEMKFPMLYHN